MPKATMNSKGQITIPKSIRDAFNIKPGDRIEFFINDQGKLVIWPITEGIISMKGIVDYSGPVVSVDDVNEVIQKRDSKM